MLGLPSGFRAPGDPRLVLLAVFVILKSLMDEDIDNIDADMFLSTIERLSSNNENVKAAIMDVWGSWKELLEPLFWQTKNQKQFISRLLHFVSHYPIIIS